MKQTTANLLKIESTSIDNFAGDVTGQSIIATASGPAEKGETAQVFGNGGMINNPSRNTIGLRISKGSLDIIVANMNYSIPLPENPGETLLYSTDEDGNIKAKHYMNNEGIHTFNDGEDFAVAFTDLTTAFTNQDTSTNAEFTKLTTTIGAMVTAFATLGVTIPPYTQGTITTDISASKVEEIKIP